MAPNRTDFSPEYLRETTAEEVFHRLIRAGNGGVTVRSNAAPALSTQFVKSEKPCQARPGINGYFAEISYPPVIEVQRSLARRHGSKKVFGYSQTAGTDANPGGFGERAAQALVKDEKTYQLKGQFPSAMLAMSKLRARVEARQGDVGAVNRIFAHMWGIDEDSAEDIPHVHVQGTEATRLAAMEDRAYHALSGHPGHNGNYRVNTVSLNPQAFGDDVPLNWARIRTGLKAIALMQIQGDPYLQAAIGYLRRDREFKFGMDIVQDSQPKYARPIPWEPMMDALINPEYAKTMFKPGAVRDIGLAISSSMHEARIQQILGDPDIEISRSVQRIAETVTKKSMESVEKLSIIIEEQEYDRQLIEDDDEDAFDTMVESDLVVQFKAPRLKVTRQSLRSAMRNPRSGPDRLPDVTTSAKMGLQLDMGQLRNAGLTPTLDLIGALHLAVYLVAMNPKNMTYVYALMNRVRAPPPIPGKPDKVAIRLRNSSLYHDPEVFKIGEKIFDTSFLNTMQMLIRNMVLSDFADELAIKHELWRYLNGRTGKSRACPTQGGWKDMLLDILDQPEAWTLYYWVRIAVGKRQYQSSDGLMASIGAGEVTDMTTLLRNNAKERVAYWKAFYQSKYKSVERDISEERHAHQAYLASIGESDVDATDCEKAKTYIPPHLRKQVDLEHLYTLEHNRYKLKKEEQYKYMVEMQSKHKLFSAIQVSMSDDRFYVGISNEAMREMQIECYQARWLSLDRRLKRALARDEKLHIGPYEFDSHPWGDLIVDFPLTYSDVIASFSELDKRAWTVEPEHMFTKFKKSLGELWNDIRNEVTGMLDYVNQVHDGIAEYQEELMAERQFESIRYATAGAEAITIPTFGYQAPYKQTARNITTQIGQEQASVKASSSAFAPIQTEEEDSDLDEIDMLEDIEDDVLFIVPAGVSDLSVATIQESNQHYLTYRTIWHILGYAETREHKIKFALFMDPEESLDSEHVDTMRAPVLLVGEENLVRRKWARKIPLIEHRLATGSREVLEDDM